MTDTPLYMAIGIPSFLVVLALGTNMVQINRLADRMDRVAEQQSAKIEVLSTKIDRVAEQLSAKIDKVDAQLSAKIDRVAEQQSARIDRLAEQQHKDSLTLQSYMVPLHERMAMLEMKQK